MLAYDEYLKRLQKNVNKVRQIRKVLLIVLPLFCALLLLGSAFLFFYGTITDGVQCRDYFIGDVPEYAAKAFLCEPEYLFYKEGHNENASTALPAEPGIYIIEAVGGNGKGERRHSKAQFAVLPLSLSIKPSEGNAVYGEQSRERELLCTGLAEGDCVVSYAYMYQYYYPELTAVITPDTNSLMIRDRDGNDVTSHYRISSAESITVSVDPVAVSVGLKENISVPYDGEAHSYQMLAVTSGALAQGDILEYTLPGASYTQIGQYTLHPESVRILTGDGQERDAYYDITLCDIALSIEKRSLTVTSADAAFSYSHFADFVPSYSVSGDGLLPGHQLEVTFDPIPKDVGSFIASFTVSVVDEKTGTSADAFYELNCNAGVVSVLQESITVQTGSATKTYDGTPLTCLECEVVEGILTEGHRLVMNTGNQPIYAGQYNNKPVISVLDEKGKDVSSLYSIRFKYGTLIIQPAEITIRSLDYSKEYDGTELYGYEYKLVSGVIYDDVYFHIFSKSSQTEVGKTQNLFIVDSAWTKCTTSGKSTQKNLYWKNGSYSLSSKTENTQVLNSYKINYEYGTLEVTRGKLIITGLSAQKRYDGTPLTCRRYSFNLEKLPKNCRLDLNFYGTITEIGKTDNPFDAALRDANGNDVTEQYFYSVQKEYGTLTVFNDYGGGNGGSGSSYDSGDSGGSSDGDVSSSVSAAPFDDDQSVVFRIASDYDGIIYLKNRDYNEYRNSNWTNNMPSLSEYYFGQYASPNNPLGINFKNTDALFEMTLYAADGNPFDCHLYPEYIYLQNNYRGNISDTLVLNGKSDYSFRFFSGAQALEKSFGNKGSSGDVSGYRNALEKYYCGFMYYEYVFFDNMRMNDPGFKQLGTLVGNADALAEGIAKYLGSICSYTMDFPEVPAGENPVLYFLSTSHQGVCSHFASAATLMCRYYGLPARYTVGYIAYSTRGETSDILANQAHAWCEYYDSVSNTWKVLEATRYAINLDKEQAAFAEKGAYDSALGEIFSEEQNALNRKRALTVTVKDTTVSFDGLAHRANKYAVEGTLSSGDRVTMKWNNDSRMYVGSSACSGVPSVLDSKGRDVTENYDITVIPGIVTVTPLDTQKIPSGAVHVNEIFGVSLNSIFGISAQPVEITAAGFPKAADSPPVLQNYPCSLVSGTELQFIALLPCQLYRMSFEFRDLDLNGDGIDEFTSGTVQYDISIQKETTVVPMGIRFEEAVNLSFVPNRGYGFGETDGDYRLLDIEMLSAERTYNGKALKVNSCAILGGSLRDGDTLTCVGNVQKYAGECRNACVSVCIFNSAGMDVTSDYLIRAFEGSLRVLPLTATRDSGTENIRLFSSVYPDDRLEENSSIYVFTYVQISEGGGLLQKDRQLISVLPGKTDVSLESGCDFNQDGIIDLYLTENITYVSRFSWWQVGIAVILVAVPPSLTVIGLFGKKRRQDPASAETEEQSEEDAT